MEIAPVELSFYTDLVSVLVQSALRLIVLNSYSPGIYHCMISSTAWTKLK